MTVTEHITDYTDFSGGVVLSVLNNDDKFVCLSLTSPYFYGKKVFSPPVSLAFHIGK